MLAVGTRLAVVLLIVAGVPAAAGAGQNVVRRWNSAALEAVRRSTLAPPAVARALAIVHTCMYDAWAASDPIALGVQYHAKDLSAGAEERRARAVSYAAYRALLNLFPAQAPLLDGVMTELGLDPRDRSDPDSVRGLAAAQAGLDAREFDGANQGGNYADYTGYAPVNPGNLLLDPNRWKPLVSETGNVQRFALPHWGRVEPFALRSSDQFRPPPPAQYPHGSYVKQALAVAHLNARLGDREKAMAGYWADGPRTETPPGHWCLLAQFVSERDGHTIEQDVKLFFALANSLMDAGIAVWEAKRHYDSPRPVTAIRFLFAGRPIHAWAGPFQGTQLIPADEWQSYLPTPPFAEYVSGHSTFSAAAAEILRSFTGSDAFGAQVTIDPGSSPIEPGIVPAAAVTLAWRTFTEAADEAGMSRRYGGIHFEDGDLAGRGMGRQIGRLVWQAAQAYFDGTAQVP